MQQFAPQSENTISLTVRRSALGRCIVLQGLLLLETIKNNPNIVLVASWTILRPEVSQSMATSTRIYRHVHDASSLCFVVEVLIEKRVNLMWTYTV